MRPADTSDLWWRTAVIYCLDIETFQDADGDGIGDIAGLIDRIEYLAELGITCLWLMPFQPTRDLDDGYDITDFYGVHRPLGDLGAFVELLRVAHARGIRVMFDLVVNHTSDRHPWFVDARRSRSARHRDFYIWRDEPPEDAAAPMFPDDEDGVWELDERTGQYYRHSFYRHQPDLNLANPEVGAEITRVIGYWAQLGVDGFRVDAVPFLIDAPGAPDDEDPHRFLRELHRFVGRRRGDAALLGEVGLAHEEQLEYFGTDGAEMDLQFDFLTMQRTFLSLARSDARPLAETLAARPEVPASRGWAMFLRNHDELTLELLTDDEREEVFEAFAPDEDQRVHGRGIVRRLAPMLRGDPRRLRMAYSLLFSLPGAPMLLYGEEIGMGEIPGLSDRAAVRTAMQWDAGRGGGFSDVAPSRRRPRLVDGGYGPEHVNVQAQRHDPESLLSFIRTLVSRYRSCPAIAWGRTDIIDAQDQAVLVHAARSAEAVFVAIHGFSEEPRTVRVRVDGLPEGAMPLDMLDPQRPVEIDGDALRIELEAYGFRWLLFSRR